MMYKAGFFKLAFIILSAIIVFHQDLRTYTSIVLSYEWIGYSLVTPLVGVFSWFSLRQRLTFVISMKSSMKVGILILATSIAMYSLSVYVEGIFWLRSMALAAFVAGLVSLLFSTFLARMLIVPISTVSLFILPFPEVAVATIIALLFFVASVIFYLPRKRSLLAQVGMILLLPLPFIFFRYEATLLALLVQTLGIGLAFFIFKNTAVKTRSDSCSSCTKTMYQGGEFCARSGRLLASPKSHFNQKDLIVIIGVSILLIITSLVKAPIFTSYNGELTIWDISVFSYENNGLFTLPKDFTLKPIKENSSSTYLLENSHIKTNIKIYVDEEVKFKKDLENLQAGEKLTVAEIDGNLHSIRFNLLNGQSDIKYIIYWSGQSLSLTNDGFNFSDLAIIIESSDNSTITHEFLRNTADFLATRWSTAANFSYDLWRSWQIYKSFSDYLPTIPMIVVTFALGYSARQKDSDGNTFIEYALNMPQSDQFLLASLISAASKTGSASGLEIESIWRELSPSGDQSEYHIDRLDEFSRLGLVEKLLDRNNAEPLLRWKPRF